MGVDTFSINIPLLAELFRILHEETARITFKKGASGNYRYTPSHPYRFLPELPPE